MHPNAAFGWSDEAAMRSFISEVAFARIFAATPSGPRVAHAPVLVTATGALRFHLANANALAGQIDGAVALVLVEGPNAYVSANWYADARGSVPTWNYVAVECEGPVARLDQSALVDLLDRLSALLEPRVGENWTRAKMQPDRFAAMLSAITAFELAPTALRGTRKLSQNKPASESERVAASIERSGNAALAAMMRGARA